MDKDTPLEVLESVFPSVGFIAVNWTFIEMHLDSWTAVIFHFARHIEKEIPKAFSRKARFLRKCFRRVPELHALRDEGLSYIERACVLSSVRHFAVHGVPSQYDETDQCITFSRLGLDDDKTLHTLETLRITQADLMRKGREAFLLAEQASEFSFRLFEALETKHKNSTSLRSRIP